jgi:hypothetical protein
MMRKVIAGIVLAAAAALSPLWIAYAATVGAFMQNDTVANSLSFNDSFGHQVVIGTYNSGTGVWAASVGGGGPITASTIAATGVVTLGANGGAAGEVDFKGSTSGTAILKPPAVASSPTFTFPTVSGTLVTTANALLASVTTQYFTATGTYTPNAKMLFAIVEAVGGGASGGSVPICANLCSGGGGGSGNFSRCRLTTAQVGASQAVTIGAGGAAPAAGSNAGLAGADTTLGTLCTGKGAPAGAGAGVNAAVAVGGAGGPLWGGIVATDDSHIGNSGGQGPGSSISTVAMLSGEGGSGPYGGGVLGINQQAGLAGTDCGSGGTGASSQASSAAAAGGAGFKGCMKVTEYDSQ